MYKCPECGYTSAEPGECPMCSVPMIEVEDGDSEENTEVSSQQN